MTKRYAKKREPIRAVQWDGELSPDVVELVGQREVHVDDDRQLIFSNDKGPGRFAQVGDWIYSTSGEDLSLMGDDQFRKIYEEIESTPMDEEHEAAAQALVRELDVLLVAGLKLSREDHPDIFRDRDSIQRHLRGLLEDHAYIVARRERHRIRNQIAKELTP